MLWSSSICVLCILQLVGAICDCGNDQQTFIPSFFIIDPPSPFNGTDGSPSSFGSSCVEENSLYQCTNNSDNPLFDCSANSNSYYEWDGNQLRKPVSLVTYFTNHFQSMNVSITFLISTSSKISVSTVLHHSVTLNEMLVPSSSIWDYLPANLPEGTYQYHFTLSPGVMFDGVVITITSNTTFQWVAISKIVFCGAANEVIPVLSNDDDDNSDSARIYKVLISVGAVIGTLLLIISLLLIIILLLHIKKQKIQKAGQIEPSSKDIDQKSQQHTHHAHAITGVLSQGTNALKIVNELSISVKAKSHDSVLQHDNSRLMPTEADYDDTITPDPKPLQIRAKSHDLVSQHDNNRSMPTEADYDDTITPDPKPLQIKAKSHDLLSQHDNNRSIPTEADYDDTITPNPNLLQIRKKPEQTSDYIEMDLSGSITSDELYDGTVVNPTRDDADFEPNPSYLLEHVGHDVRLEKNPSYRIVDLYD